MRLEKYQGNSFNHRYISLCGSRKSVAPLNRLHSALHQMYNKHVLFGNFIIEILVKRDYFISKSEEQYCSLDRFNYSVCRYYAFLTKKRI